MRDSLNASIEMRSFDSKDAHGFAVHDEHMTEILKPPAKEQIFDGNEAFNTALILEPPRPFSRISITLYLACLIGFLASTMNGYDGSLFNALTENSQFLDYFHGSATGSWQAIVSAMYQIGGVVALPFVGPAIDTWGRRWGLFIGSCFILIGAVLQGTCVLYGDRYEAATHQFMGGRFVTGFGVVLASSAGPMYVIEVSHPAFRGIVTAFYNCFWFTGAIVASSSARGADTLEGNFSWLIPVWIQVIFPLIVIVFCFFLPESPRWLYVNDRFHEARAMLAKYHGEDNIDSIWVTLQLREYDEFLEMDGADKRWWDYRALFADGPARYRVFCNVMISIWGQWAGNSVLSYFQGAVLNTIGITETIPKANINLGNNFQQFFFALIGAAVVDRVGRRPLLLFANGGCCLVWLAMTITTSIFTQSNMTNKTAADLSLLFIFLFGTVYSIGFTPLQALFPVEVLSFEMRAKGMALSSLAVNIAGLLNQFAWPISLEYIGWRTYIIFTIWCAIQTFCVWLFIPETKNRTLEELSEIFDSRTPVKASLQKKKMAWDIHGEIINIEMV